MIEALQKMPWQLKEFDKPLVTASYFGFLPIVAPKICEQDLEATEHCMSLPHYDAAEKAALIRTYIESDMASLPHPLAIIYKRRAQRPRAGGPTAQAGYSLHYIGAPTALAEAALIRATLSILAEEGKRNLRVDLNSVGDKDSICAYERELANYVRKSTAAVSDELKALLKEDIFNLFRHEHEEAIALRAGAPSSLSFLSSASRSHFKEVLEYIEAMGIEFGLEPSLVGEKNHSSHTIFGIRETGVDAELAAPAPGGGFLAVGYRYSRLGRRLGMKKEVPMASVAIFSHGDSEGKMYKGLPKPKFYLIQLGREAKIRTLHILEMLRTARIPVHHFLGRDKLSIQLSSAEELRVSYLIIIGHKEALDGTATIRNMSTRAQDTIPLALLPQYLKTIKL